jgi:hypothetical protein
VENEKLPETTIHKGAPSGGAPSGSERVRAVDDAIAELLAELRSAREDRDGDDDEDIEVAAGATLPWKKDRKQEWSGVETTPSRAAGNLESFVPPPVPASFRRDRLGRWRHRHGGGYVHHASDIRLRDAFPFERTEYAVYVPTAVVRCQPLFKFCSGYPVSVRGVWPCFEVPVDLFDEYGSESVGFTAPEVALPFLVDTAGFAAFLNVSPRTVSAYLARGTLPEPVARIGSSPVWSLTQLSLWVEHRAADGRSRKSQMRRQRRGGRG